MKSLPSLQKNLLMASVLTAMTACSSGPTVQEFPVSASPTEEISKLENDMSTAELNQVGVLAPENFQDARDALNDAKKMSSKGKDAEDTLYKVAVGRAYLSSANAAAEVARNNIGSVINAREAALSAGAQNYFGKDFEKVEDDFKDLNEDIEDNKLGGIDKQRGKLQSRYLDLELMAIKEKHLKQSRDGIALAKKEDAKKWAPKTLSIAEKSLADTEAYITANRHNTYGIENRAEQTNLTVDHAININRISKNQKDLPPEELALMLEQERQRVAAEQSKLRSVTDELKSTQSALDREKDSAASLEQSKEYLEAQKRLNEKYELARQQFSADEAEVFKQGDALVIRLKGMEFPSAKATIQPKNEELLGKVQKVMEDFGSSTVVVQGHTDSVGGKAINDRLSKNRAQAVKEYLQSNSGGIIEPAKIEAVGYGYQKPLATNKTADGRAKNRRVDIVIKPDSSKF